MADKFKTKTISVAQKASNGIIVAFPDVCKTPIPTVPNLIPYPSFATVANNEQEKNKTEGKMVSTKKPRIPSSKGDEAGKIMGAASSKNQNLDRYTFGLEKTFYDVKAQNEIGRLKSEISNYIIKLLNMTSKDPNEWQRALQEYSVRVSALFMTKNAINK